MDDACDDLQVLEVKTPLNKSRDDRSMTRDDRSLIILVKLIRGVKYFDKNRPGESQMEQRLESQYL